MNYSAWRYPVKTGLGQDELADKRTGWRDS